MKHDRTQSLREAIGKYLKEEKLEGKLNEHKLIGMWQELMGPTIASRTARMFIKKGDGSYPRGGRSVFEELRVNWARMMQILGVHSVGAALDNRPVLGRGRIRVKQPNCLAISINVQNV